uniref:Alpha-conotoxin MI n=2 Tax=Conus magus TaxID=6492 RepID=CA1_CONMA|nr:RecName: Full=Alpha-conotoxin MI; Short=Alpha-MI; Short=CtxMI; AltName: Full=M1 [Conus magus]
GRCCHPACGKNYSC